MNVVGPGCAPLPLDNSELMVLLISGTDKLRATTEMGDRIRAEIETLYPEPPPAIFELARQIIGEGRAKSNRLAWADMFDNNAAVDSLTEAETGVLRRYGGGNFGYVGSPGLRGVSKDQINDVARGLWALRQSIVQQLSNDY